MKLAVCTDDLVSNKMWKGDIVEILDAEQRKYKGIKGHNVEEIFWCVANVRKLTEEELMEI
ncbi:hypothetical protein BSK59_13240 [Paenibacillus odorifer]|uniref:hypothetical protein n=1 Tax=Paenibacillus odorifer TaxID=189426 RepID=UPI00096DA10A|nr:hypothetical protein [Paenibacillus odorifer]OME55436.1 hypothetical protein BSK59_13240 [Paenibacillus odorifer]